MQILLYHGPEDRYDDQERKGDPGGKPAPLSPYTAVSTSANTGQQDYRDQDGDDRRRSDSPCRPGSVRDRHNTAVYSQLKEICESLQEHGLKSSLLLWPIAKGKGFDDLLLSRGSSYHKHMVDISYKRFEPLYDKAVQGVLDHYGAARVRDIKGSADRAAFNKDVQEAVETAVGL